MAVPPKKNTAFTLYVSLTSMASAPNFQANPTLASGDVKVAIDDGAPANLATLPVVDGDFTKRVKVALSASEMNGDVITVIFSDQAGAEWADLSIDIHTTLKPNDDLSTAASISALNNLSAAQVNTEVDTALADYNGPTHAELIAEIDAVQTDIANLNDLSAAQVNAEVDTALADYDPPTSAELVSEINSVQTDIGNLNNLSAAQVLTQATAALTTYDPPTHAELIAETDSVQTDIANLNDLSAAEVKTQADAALVDIHLDHLLAVDYNPAAQPGVATALFNELIESDGGVSQFTANALEEAPAGGGGGGGATAEEIWTYFNRTLTLNIRESESQMDDDPIIKFRGTRWSISATGLLPLDDYDEIYFSVKARESDADPAALVRVSLTGGLERINKQAVEVGEETDGSITVDNAPAGALTIVLEAVQSAKLAPNKNLLYDIKAIDTATSAVVVLAAGRFIILGDITRAIE